MNDLIKSAHREARGFNEELRYLNGYENVVAAHDWLVAGKNCGWCHGTGYRLEPLFGDVIMVSHVMDGVAYRHASIFVGGAETGCIYHGYVPMTREDWEPKIKKVMCNHDS